MAWKIEYTDQALKQLKKIDRKSAQRIVDFMDDRVANANDARQLGKALKGPLGTFWRYRFGDYRLFCEIHDDRLVIMVMRLGHRRDVYR